MNTDAPRPFNKRKFVVLMAAISGAGLPLTGFANHLLQMEPMMRERHAWMTAHWTLGIIFVVFVIWHAIFNRQALLNYVRAHLPRRWRISREGLWAAAAVALILSLAVGHAFHPQ